MNPALPALAVVALAGALLLLWLFVSAAFLLWGARLAGIERRSFGRAIGTLLLGGLASALLSGLLRSSPYVGAGLGWAHIKWSDSHTFNAVERVGHDSSDNTTAAQIMLGFSYAIPEAEGLQITAELRHTRLLGDLTFKGRVLESRFGSFPISTDVSDKGRTEINIGLRRSF